MTLDDVDLKQKASEAMIKRLVTCMVNEDMVATKLLTDNHSFNLPTFDYNHLSFITQKDSINPQEGFLLKLQHLPLLREIDSGFSIGLLDPMDIQFPFYYYSNDKLTELDDVTFIMEKVSIWNNFDAVMVKKVTLELLSCVEHQYHAYLNRKEILNVDTAKAIEWEQSIVEGHPTHPMNKARHAIAPIPYIKPEEDMLSPKMIVCKVPREEVTILGKYESVLKPLYEELAGEVNIETEALIMVHELQVYNLKEKFPNVKVLSKQISSLSQATLRTMKIDGFPNFNFKLPLGIKVTSALRTVSPWTTFFGPNFGRIAQKINLDKENLIIVDEVGSIVSNHPSIDMAKHLSCLIREEVEVQCLKRDEKVIIAAALTEIDFDNVSVLTKVFNLNTYEKRVSFFKTYCEKYLTAFLTPVIKFGIAWESHLQNTLCRFKKVNEEYQLVGFAIRDFGGIKVHQDTLFDAIGEKVLVFNEDASQLAHNKQDMYHVAYHTMFMMHLHRILRCLNLHYNGIGWEIVRKELDRQLPKDHELRHHWLENKEADFKAFISMKLDGLFRDYLYTKVPNLISYQIPKKFESKVVDY
ncbi:hypothetical protein K502DRAFT_326122 [Neoconidiobolus thromboides FSU 785]|nr:hypothetical protein K502DRAFT_326122 [Neoconidiobolus thromboides FSU 785]